MISGMVVGLQARLSVLIRILDNAAIEIECVVDTGFEGFLTFPPAAITKLGLPYLARIDANLADNSSVATNAYLATIFWNGAEREIAVLGMVRMNQSVCLM